MNSFWTRHFPPRLAQACLVFILLVAIFIASVIVSKNTELIPLAAPDSILAPSTKAAFVCSSAPWPLRRALTMYARAANTARLNYIADHFELAADGFGDEIAYIRQRNPNFRFVNYNSITDNYLDAEHDWLTANATAYGVPSPEDIYLHYSQDTVSRLEGVDVTIRGWPPGPGATAQSREESRVRVYYANPARARYVTAFHTPELRALQRAYHVYLLNQVARGGGNQYWNGFMFDNASFNFLQTGLPSPSIPTGPVREAGGLYANSTTFYNWYYYQGFGLFEQELRTNQPPVGRRVWIVPNVAGSPVITQDTWQEAYVNRLQPGDVILKEFSHNPTRDFGQTLPATIFYKNGLAQTAGIDLWEFPINITSIVGRQGSFTTDEAMMNNLGLHWLTRRPNILTWGFVNIVSQVAWDNNMRGLFDTDLGQALEDPQVLTTGTDGRGYAYTVYSRRFACGLSVVRVRGAEPQHFDAATAVTVNLPGTYLPLDVDGNRGASTSTATLRNGQGLLFLAQGATPPPACTENWTCTAWSTCSGSTQTRTCTDANSCGTTTSRPPLSQSCTTPPPTCTENWSCTTWSSCVSGQQTRTCTDSNNCGTTVNRPPLSQSCSTPPPACTENWTCTAWSTCSGGTQTRTCTDANSCGTTTSRPPLSQSCSTPPPVCIENWSCTTWSSCVNGQQTRTCTDANNCGTTTNRPVLSQTCGTVCNENWSCSPWSACTGGQLTRSCTDANNCGTTVNRPPLTQSCSSTCTPNWSCTPWSACTAGSQGRTCTDSNNCGTTSGRPPTSQSCSGVTPSCTSAWSCTVWSTCTNNTQTRTCTDTNSCSTATNRPLEQQSCTSTGSGSPDEIIIRDPIGNTPGSHGATSLLKTAHSSTLYYIGADYKKYIFPDAATYFSWFDRFENVKTVSVAELDKYENGGVITYRPGTYLATTNDTAKVYAVTGQGRLYWIRDEATAARLYGPDWTQRVRSVIPGFFVASYYNTSEILNTLPIGTLLQYNNEYYIINRTNELRKVSNSGLSANRFKSSMALPVNTLSGYVINNSPLNGQESNYFYLR